MVPVARDRHAEEEEFEDLPNDKLPCAIFSVHRLVFWLTVSYLRVCMCLVHYCDLQSADTVKQLKQTKASRKTGEETPASTVDHITHTRGNTQSQAINHMLVMAVHTLARCPSLAMDCSYGSLHARRSQRPKRTKAACDKSGDLTGVCSLALHLLLIYSIL